MEENFHKKLLKLVMPIALQQFMLSLVSASDALMLGQLSQDALSAVSLAGQVMFVFNLFLLALTIGASIFAAQYWGKGDREMVERVLAFVLRIALMVSAVFFAGTVFVPESLMRLFTPDRTLVAYGTEYLRVVGISYVLCGASQIYLCIMKNSGYAGKSTLISSVAVVLNIVLNAILIFGLFGAPEMGIAGAAAATVIARGAELIWAVLDSCRDGRIRLRGKYFWHTDRELRSQFWKYTAPVLGNELVWGCGYSMYSVIMGHLGSDAVAANSVANILNGMMICFCRGIGNGGSILVGNELGAGRLEQAKVYGGRLCRLSIWAGAVSGILMLAAAPLVLRYSGLGETAAGYLKWLLVMGVYYMVGQAVNSTTIAGIFCAGGDTRFGLLCDIIVMWGLMVPLGMLAAFVWRLPVLAVYFILRLDEMLKLPAVYRHYKKYGWVRDLTGETAQSE